MADKPRISERLRALDGARAGNWFYADQLTVNGHAAWTLANALPLIADCIEAAENEVAENANKAVVREGLTPERSRRIRIERALADSLTALEEALVPGDPEARVAELEEAMKLAIEDLLLMDSPEGDSPRNIASNLRAALRGEEGDES